MWGDAALENKNKKNAEFAVADFLIASHSGVLFESFTIWDNFARNLFLKGSVERRHKEREDIWEKI